MQKKITIGFVLLILSIISSFFYRPYIYSNKLRDFYLADTVNNFLAVFIAYYFLPYLIKSKTSQFSLIIQITIGFIFYEVIQYFTRFGTFDIKDVITTGIAGLILLLITLIKSNKSKKQNAKSMLSQTDI